MVDYIRRVLIAGLLALCVSLLFLSGRAAHAEENDTSSWLFPANGYITDHFGTRGGNHKGIDIGGEHGSPVFSVDDGVITKSYYSSSYGHVIFIKHPNGYETVYGHLDQRGAVEGQAVKKGEKIGTMGNTGRSTGTHLHFEIHQGEWNITKNMAIDPYLVFGEGETGQTVFAKEHDPYQVREVALKVSQTEDMHPSDSSQGKEEADKQIHIVKSGETLWSIAQTYEVSTVEVMNQNDLNDSTIVSGQPLLIPEKSGEVHLVKQGETLFGIAQQYNISVEDLTGWNGLKKDEPILPAQELVVRRK
jgi:murein DD-endopeptidase MepM/ murein hydrolase activator NlpD